MKCPKCDHTLVATKVREVEVDRCKSCQGIWCDHRELGELLGQNKWRLHKLTGAAPQDQLNRKRAKCPRDQTDLIRVGSVHDRKIVLDSCPTCKGIWLDGGELDRLLEATPGGS